MAAPTQTHRNGNGVDPAVWIISMSCGFFIAYLWALPSDITWGDGPELAASAWELGIPHPTGYSLYMMLLHGFQALPVGTVAFRSHLFSALCASASLAVLGLLLLKITERLSGNTNPLPAVLSITALGTTRPFWDMATETEVYALFALLLSLLLFLTHRMLAQQRMDAWLPLVTGLSLVHHRLALFTIAFSFVVWLIVQWKTQWSLFSFRQIGMQGSCLLAPLLLLLYFPIRAATDPAINWYDPVTFDCFYALVSGELYRDIPLMGLRAFLGSMNLYSVMFPALIPLAGYSLFSLVIIYGIIRLGNDRHWFGLGLCGLAVVYWFFMRIYLVGDWYVFLLPVVVLMSIPLCAGLTTVVEFIAQRPLKRSIRTLAYSVLTGCALLPAFTPYNQEKGILQRPMWVAPFPVSGTEFMERFSRTTEATRYASRAWSAIPDGSFVLIGLNEPTSDNELHPLLYQQIVEERNPNSVLISGGFLYLDWYRNQIAEKTGLSLPATNDEKFASREDSFDAMWEEIISPILERDGYLFTPSLGLRAPLYPTWRDRLETRILVTPHVNPATIAFSYRPFVPGGTITKLLPETP